MSERLTRSPITPPPQSEQEAMLRLGLEFEETPGGLVVTYPEGAIRETINEEDRRYAVFFVHHYEQRQVTEAYNWSTRSYILL
jgi:hypothetical protein